MIFFTPQGSSPLGSFLDLVGPHPSVKRLITKLVPAPLFDIFLPRHAMVVEISETGEIMSSHHDPGATRLTAVSEAFEYDGKIYFGHFKIPYVGFIDAAVFKGEKKPVIDFIN